jgi:hypothetical protein
VVVSDVVAVAGVLDLEIVVVVVFAVEMTEVEVVFEVEIVVEEALVKLNVNL